MGDGSESTTLVAGQLRRQTKLETTATYQVVAVSDTHAVLEVWDAPGLTPGFTMRVTRAAAEAMELTGVVPAHGRGSATDAA